MTQEARQAGMAGAPPGPDPSVAHASAAPSVAPGPVPSIRVRHLWHRFGRFDVLRDVSFDVMPGEIFGFIGPNGAGKTTTIRIMSTLLEPMAGRVEVDGYDVTLDPDAVRKIIGYMPDHAGVYERVTVREYLEFFADAYGVVEPHGASGEREYPVVDAVMELTDLTKLRDKLVATMSKGMKQRLQLARTLLHDPKVLILDEPASDLDPRARIEIRDLLVELRSMGKTIFLSSHILTELADVCTSVAILERGRLVVAGPISEIARRLERRNAVAPQPNPAGALPGGAPLPYPGPAAPPPGQPAIDPVTGAPIAPPPASPVSQDAAAGAATAVGAPQPAAWAPPAPALIRRTVKLKVLAPGEAVAHALTGMREVEAVGPGPGGTVVVTYLGDDPALAAVVRALVVANVPVVGVEPERNELERIFLEVTKGEVQ